MIPFTLQADTKTVTAAGTPPTAALVGNGLQTQVVVTNIGEEDILVAWGATSDDAVAKATAGNFVYPVLARTQVSITAPTNKYYTAKALANTSVVYFSPGYGS